MFVVPNELLLLLDTKNILPAAKHTFLGMYFFTIIFRYYSMLTYLGGEFHAWDNCTSMGISVIFYPCKQIKLY